MVQCPPHKADDFGTHGVLLTDNNTFVNGLSVKDTIHAVTVGVNYHF